MQGAEILKTFLPQIFGTKNDRPTGEPEPAVTVISDVKREYGPFSERHVWLAGHVPAEDIFRLNGTIGGFTSWKHTNGWENEPQTELIYPRGVRPVVVVTVLPETLQHKILRNLRTIFQFGHNGHSNDHQNIQK